MEKNYQSGSVLLMDFGDVLHRQALRPRVQAILYPVCKFVISRPVRQALLDLVQQALLDLKQYRGITKEKKKIM